jgi:hypothetical protein
LSYNGLPTIDQFGHVVGHVGGPYGAEANFAPAVRKHFDDVILAQLVFAAVADADAAAR